MIKDSVGPNGVLDTDKITAALLMHHNKPGADTGLSSGRKIKDLLPHTKGKLVVRPKWHEHMRATEIVLAKKHIKRGQELSEHCQTLKLFLLIETFPFNKHLGIVINN